MVSSAANRTESTVRFIRAVRERIAEVVVGQDVVVERLLIALFTGGHLLLVSGLAGGHRCGVGLAALHDEEQAAHGHGGEDGNGRWPQAPAHRPPTLTGRRRW